MKIIFDMDGTLNRLYDVPDWLEMLRSNDPTPYRVAAPNLNLSRLARYLNRLQKMGHTIGVISWLAKESTPEYDAAVIAAKYYWLARHMPSVIWDIIQIVPYGTDKHMIAGNEGILFDDDERVRATWGDNSYEPEVMFEVLAELVEMG